MDGRSFGTIGRVTARGNTGSTNNYEFTDQHLNVVSYYRLKMIDIDGKFTYSRTIMISADIVEGLNLQSISPIPFKSYITIGLSSDKSRSVQVSIIDIWGRIQLQKTIKIQEGHGIYSINELHRLTAGNYVLVLVTDEGKKLIQRVQK